MKTVSITFREPDEVTIDLRIKEYLSQFRPSHFNTKVEYKTFLKEEGIWKALLTRVKLDE